MTDMLWSRPDGQLVADVPGYRRMMPYVMPTRTESAVYFDVLLDMERALEIVEASRAPGKQRLTVTHVLLRAGVMTLHEFPRLNRFVAGKRLYQRDGIWFSFSAKKAFTDDAPIVVIKMRFDAGTGLEGLAASVEERLARGRSSEKSYTDQETDVLLRLPRSLIRAAVSLQRGLDYWNLLPPSMIEHDIFYSSAFLANLGSIGLDAAFHHLYEYGNIPIFFTLGQVVDTPAQVDGELRLRKMAKVRVTYDERVEDGFYAVQALRRFKSLVEEPSALL